MCCGEAKTGSVCPENIAHLLVIALLILSYIYIGLYEVYLLWYEVDSLCLGLIASEV